MRVTVRVFHDQKRVFEPVSINTTNILTIDQVPTIHFGPWTKATPKGENVCHKVVFRRDANIDVAGHHVYVHADDVEALLEE